MALYLSELLTALVDSSLTAVTLTTAHVEELQTLGPEREDLRSLRAGQLLRYDRRSAAFVVTSHGNPVVLLPKAWLVAALERELTVASQ